MITFLIDIKIIFIPQHCFLGALGISPSGNDPWPLTVYPRSLAALVSILLRHQQHERAQGAGQEAEFAVISIWDRFLKRLHAAADCLDSKTEIMEGWLIKQTRIIWSSDARLKTDILEI